MSKEREKAINQVAESVTELADIFKEIQVLVIDQVRRRHTGCGFSFWGGRIAGGGG